MWCSTACSYHAVEPFTRISKRAARRATRSPRQRCCAVRRPRLDSARRRRTVRCDTRGAGRQLGALRTCALSAPGMARENEHEVPAYNDICGGKAGTRSRRAHVRCAPTCRMVRSSGMAGKMLLPSEAPDWFPEWGSWMGRRAVMVRAVRVKGKVATISLGGRGATVAKSGERARSNVW